MANVTVTFPWSQEQSTDGSNGVQYGVLMTPTAILYKKSGSTYTQIGTGTGSAINVEGYYTDTFESFTVNIPSDVTLAAGDLLSVNYSAMVDGYGPWNSGHVDQDGSALGAGTITHGNYTFTGAGGYGGDDANYYFFDGNIDEDGSDCSIANLVFTAGGGAVNATITQVHGTITVTGGTQTVVSKSNASTAQVAGTVTITGGTQAPTATIIASSTITQVAGTVTVSGGTQTPATTRLVNITQTAGTVTVSGGTQTVVSQVNTAVTQLAGTITVTGGTQAISTSSVASAAISQLAGTITVTGGTQVIATVQNATVGQSAGTITVSGGTQTPATVNDVSITQSAGTITISGGTQVLSSVQNASLTQVAGTITVSGGTQSANATRLVSISQLAGTVTVSGGTQTVQSVQNVQVSQSAGTITVSGGTQSENAVSAVLSGTITTALESDIVAGGKTIILTLTGDTWVASGATFNAQRQNIINGITSAQSETFGWNLVPKMLQSVSGVVRTSNTVVTVTLDAFPTYNVTSDETITATIPATAVTTNAIVAIPSLTIQAGTPAFISQVAGTITVSGGTQTVATVHSTSISQTAGTITVSGGNQIYSINSSPLPASYPKMIFVDSDLAMELSGKFYSKV